MWDENYGAALNERLSKAYAGGGPQRVEKQHAAGKLTARERLGLLFDENTFMELGALAESESSDFGMEKKRLPGDGVIAGYGKVDGRTVFASSQDFTVIGGSLGEAHARKICAAMDMAMEMRAPFISINDSGGARIEEGIGALNGYGDIFLRNTRASGVIPQISVIMGPCAGGACYSPAISDFIFMTQHTSQMYITGPQVVKAVTGEQITPAELGGADVHMGQSGVAHFCYEDDYQCLAGVRKLLKYLPAHYEDRPPAVPAAAAKETQPLEELVPDHKKRPYNVLSVISALVDADSFLEVQPWFARNIVIGFARLDGKSVGIVANQPNFMGGSLDLHAADKAARFIRFCDCFGIPIVTLVDVPAFLPGRGQEHQGIIRHGAKLLYAYSEATVPTISVIMRKAYGGAYIAMNSKSLGADLVYAWPIAEIAVMGSDGAVNIVFRKDIQAAEDQEAARAEKIAAYEEKFMNPYVAAGRGFVDEVIHPEQTRDRLSTALEMLERKNREQIKKRHGNIPL